MKNSKKESMTFSQLILTECFLYLQEKINWKNSGVYVIEFQIMSIMKRCKGKSLEMVVEKANGWVLQPLGCGPFVCHHVTRVRLGGWKDNVCIAM